MDTISTSVVLRKHDISHSSENNRDIIKDYNKNYKKDASKELKYFAGMSSLDLAIECAGMARMPSGKRFSHQNRIPSATLIHATGELISKQNEIESCKSFDELYATIKKTVGPIKGIGELYVYDTTLRLGSYLDLKPEKIYLHTGTREGVRKLGINHSKLYCEINELPVEFHHLDAFELEDILCIYKKSFTALEK